MTPACKSNTILQEKEQELFGEEADAQAGAGKCRISQKHLVVLESRKVLNQTQPNPNERMGACQRDTGANLREVLTAKAATI